MIPQKERLERVQVLVDLYICYSEYKGVLVSALSLPYHVAEEIICLE